MCRYRVYYYTCGHTEVEPEPYLPCHPTDYCSPQETTDKPIGINKATPCGDSSCEESIANPLRSPTAPPHTSWEATNGKQTHAPGDRLRHTVSTKMKMNSIVRSLTKKKNERSSPKLDNGGAGFLEDAKGGPRSQYQEIHDDLQK